MQQADPDAMKGDYGVDSVDAVAESPYFVGLERRNFRNWVPITRAGLLAMVERRPITARLDPDVRAQLLAEVGDLYDTSARAPEPLLLPYRLLLAGRRRPFQPGPRGRQDALHIRL